ncbi:MAG: Rpn family recombination-promoting nuclease/putative transposase [Bacteroidota bacterium]
MPPELPSNPHDTYIREQLSDPELARTFFSKFLNETLVAVLDLETLTLMRDSYVDEELQVSFSDLVYRCGTRESKEVEICLLIEHKSYVPVRPRIQLIQYMLNAWKAQVKAEDLGKKRSVQLRPVIPILLYHGQEKWKDQPFPGYFHGIPRVGVDKYIPEFFYELIDLNTYSAEEVAEMELGMLELTVTALKFSHSMEQLLDKLERLAVVMEIHGNLETEDQRITSFFVYLYSTSEVSPGDLFQQMQKKMSETLKERALTTYEQMILPYKQELEQKERVIQKALSEVRLAKELAQKEREKAQQEQTKAQQSYRELIKLGLQLNLPITQLTQMTQLPQQEVEKIIQSIRKEEK